MERRVGLFCLLVVVALCSVSNVTANNMRVTRASLGYHDHVAKTINVVCDIAWDHSWRGVENWDAAWVFVKFRVSGSNNWEHASLATNSAAHSTVNGGLIEAVPDGRGVFLYSAGQRNGDAAYPGTRLCWDYAANGYEFATGAEIEISVMAIEMVYIPEGPFYLGSGGAEGSHFYEYTDGSQNIRPFLVRSEAPITIGTSSGNLSYLPAESAGDGMGVLPAGFPKGFRAFYCMKYEVSQGQYAAFLNKLTAAQWNMLTVTPYYGQSRMGISGTYNNTVAATPDVACNFFSWFSICAYAGWTGLRPMTELEFEKACRGPEYPVPNEYVWGSADIVLLTSEAGVFGSGSEIAGNAGANCNTGNRMGGPARCGIFATNNTSRVAAGASYYGVLDMGGNLWERIVSVGSPDGRACVGSHGNGSLGVNGGVVNTDWNNANASGDRGGEYVSSVDITRLSERSRANAVRTTTGPQQGCRLVRTQF